MEKEDGFDRAFGAFCSSPLKCILTMFVLTYLIWWLLLDGPAKWDKKFQGEIKNKKQYIINKGDVEDWYKIKEKDVIK